MKKTESDRITITPAAAQVRPVAAQLDEQAGHTRGEWFVTRHGTPEYAPQFGIYAVACPHDFIIVKSSRADADLIAAAPAMVAALKACSDYFAAIDEMQPFKAHGLVGVQVRNMTRAALAAATGQE